MSFLERHLNELIGSSLATIAAMIPFASGAADART